MITNGHIRRSSGNEGLQLCQRSTKPAIRLIRVFADRMTLQQPPGYPKRDKQEP